MTDQQLDDFTEAARIALDSVRQAWEQVRDAARDLWQGPLGQMMRRRAAVLAARRAHREDGYRDPYVEDRPPSGCAICGRPEQYHGNVWHRSTQKFGRYVRPDASTILVRMQVRRADRLDRRAGQVRAVDGLPEYMTVTDTGWHCRRCDMSRTTAPEPSRQYAVGHVHAIHTPGRAR